jgi:beta-xylosidase
MGRESVLFPVTWKEGEWPFASAVRGVMSGWELPATNLDVPGVGPFVEEPDSIEFTKGSQLAGHLLHWRYPDTDKLEISPDAHPNSLLVKPSRANLTGDWTSDDPDLTGETGLSFLARRQSHTMFSYSVDVSFDPERPGQEAGVSLFLTQWNHVDLGIVQSNANHSPAGGALEFQFRTQTSDRGSPSSRLETQITPIPASWKDCGPIRLQVDSLNSSHYLFSAHRADNPNSRLVIGITSGKAVSGGSGPFVGVLLGIYATCNGAGAEGKECPPGGEAYFNRWRYTGVAQQIDETSYIPERMWQD